MWSKTLSTTVEENEIMNACVIINQHCPWWWPTNARPKERYLSNLHIMKLPRLSACTLFRYFKNAITNVSFQYDILISLDMFITNQYLTIRCDCNAAICLWPMWSYLSSRSAGASRRSRVGSYHIVVLLCLLVEVVSSQPVMAIFLLEKFRIDSREFLDVYSPESCICQRASLWGIFQAVLTFLQCCEC